MRKFISMNFKYFFRLGEEDYALCHRIRGGCWNQTFHLGLEKLRISRRPQSRIEVVGFRRADLLAP